MMTELKLVNNKLTSKENKFPKHSVIWSLWRKSPRLIRDQLARLFPAKCLADVQVL